MSSRKKLGLAAASLLGAATVVGMSPAPASAEDVIVIICPCEKDFSPGGDPFLKIESSFSKVLLKIDSVKGTDSAVAQRLDGAFYKILLKFGSTDA